jgi:hypothetical protein
MVNGAPFSMKASFATMKDGAPTAPAALPAPAAALPAAAAAAEEGATAAAKAAAAAAAAAAGSSADRAILTPLGTAGNSAGASGGVRRGCWCGRAAGRGPFWVAPREGALPPARGERLKLAAANMHSLTPYPRRPRGRIDGHCHSPMPLLGAVFRA